MKGMHITRTWTGGDKAHFPECVCVEAPCGYVIPDDDCPQHGFRFGKTMRGGHDENACPGAAAGIPTKREGGE